MPLKVLWAVYGLFMQSGRLWAIRGLDVRESVIEAAAVLTQASRESGETVFRLGYSGLSDSLDRSGLRMPSIAEQSFESSPEYLLGEVLKILQNSVAQDELLHASIVALSVCGSARISAMGEIAVNAMWDKICRPLLEFFERDDDESAEQPQPPEMALAPRDRYQWNPHDPKRLGDYTTWARGIGPLFDTLSGWDSTWAMPPAPSGEDLLSEQIAYWSPLAHLTLGPLGWTDPTLGIARWVLHGMPSDRRELAILNRVWGPDALMFFSVTNDWVPWNDSERYITAGDRARSAFADSGRVERLVGSGEYHLRQHINWQLLEGATDDEPQLFRSAGGREMDWLLMLPGSACWYSALDAAVAEEGRTRTVHLVAPPLGYMGAFRHNGVTRRWHSTSTTVHLWGN